MKTSTIYRHLLWKEFRFLSPLVLLSVGIALLLQIVQFTTKKETQAGGIEQYLAEAIPFLVGMICVGVSIGHERDNRSWNWFSSIPVPWKHVLGSKAIAISVFVISAATILQLSEHGLLSWTNRTDNLRVPFSERVLYPATVTGCFLLVLFSSVLAMRQTLSGIILALLFLSVGLAFLPTYVVAVLSVLFAAVGVSLFQWRWTSGQFTDIVQSITDFFSAQSNSQGLLIQTSSAIKMSRPSTTQAICWQIARQSLPIMLVVVTISILVRVANGQLSRDQFNPVMGFSFFLATVIIGISTLYADVRLQQFRFLSDRGVSVWATLLPRLSSAANVLAIFVLLLELSRTEILAVALLASISVAGIAITNSAIVAISITVLASLVYGFALSFFPTLGTFMRGSWQEEQNTWRALFDWNSTVHICAFSILMLLSAIWLWSVRYRRSNLWLVARFAFFVPVAFVLASMAAIPTIVYEQKDVNPQLLLGQPAASVVFYHIDGDPPSSSHSARAIIVSNLYVLGKLREYQFSHGREMLEASANRTTMPSESSQSDRDAFFAALQDKAQGITATVLPVKGSVPNLYFQTRANRFVVGQSVTLAEHAAAELAEIIFIAVFLDQPDLASVAMDKYLELMKLREPAYTEHAIAPFSLIKANEWKTFLGGTKIAFFET